MLSQLLFSALVLAVAVQRLLELRLSQRNERALAAMGGREHFPAHFQWMRATHTAWLAAMLLEVWLLAPSFHVWLALGAGVAFAVGQGLRLAAIRALGVRWTVRIFTLHGATPVSGGIYKYLRHPNYLGVALEIAALPLLHSAWRTALFFSLANALVLVVRIRCEERALAESSRYFEVLGNRRRFLPNFDPGNAA